MRNLFKTGLLVGLGVCLLACDTKQSTTEQANSTNDNVVATANPATADTVASASQSAFGVFQFEKQDHDFGTIKEGEVVKHVFKFKNVGQAPLVVADVKPQCGCTATNYTKTPVQPGETGEIEVQFDSNGRAGQNNKSATVTANTKERSTILYFTANVAAKPAGGPPIRQ